MINNKNGELLVNESDIKDRWREYFSELLNWPYPEDLIDGVEANHDIIEELNDDEILAAIKS